MQLTKNFQLSEFACKDGTPVPDEYLDNVKELAKELQVLRDFLESPLRINSAYRTKTYNKSVGGAEKSKHLVAMAADLSSYRCGVAEPPIKGYIFCIFVHIEAAFKSSTN